MPRTGPRRIVVPVRMHPLGIEALDRIGRAEGLVTPGGRPIRSEVVRLLCREAIAARGETEAEVTAP